MKSDAPLRDPWLHCFDQPAIFAASILTIEKQAEEDIDREGGGGEPSRGLFGYGFTPPRKRSGEQWNEDERPQDHNANHPMSRSAAVASDAAYQRTRPVCVRLSHEWTPCAASAAAPYTVSTASPGSPASRCHGATMSRGYSQS